MFGCRHPAVVGGLLIVMGGVSSCLSPSLPWMYLLKGIIPGQFFGTVGSGRQQFGSPV